MIKVKNVKYTYRESKYSIESIDIFAQLSVQKADYDSVLDALVKKKPECKDIRIVSFTI